MISFLPTSEGITGLSSLEFSVVVSCTNNVLGVLPLFPLFFNRLVSDPLLCLSSIFGELLIGAVEGDNDGKRFLLIDLVHNSL
jgi:hypothetical protein